MANRPKSSGPEGPERPEEAKPPLKAKPAMKAGPAAAAKTSSGPSARIDEKLQSLGDWRARTLAEIRRLIREAVPEIEEDCKWVKPTNPLGVPTWSCGGLVCTGEAYKEVVKLTFARGASLDSQDLFNAGLEGGIRRAIDLREGELPEAAAFKRLVQAAVAENRRMGGRSGV